MGLTFSRTSLTLSFTTIRIALALTAVGLIWVSGVGLFAPQAALAATGTNQQINFQGRLLTNSGAVVADGNYNMRFKIYQDGNGCVGGGSSPCSGTLKWTETHTNNGGTYVVVKNGYFSVSLGAVTAFGASVDWNQDTLWLSMDITTNGTDVSIPGSLTWNGEMLPFKRLSSAVYALNSNQLGGLTSSQYAQLAANQTFTGANIFQPAANSVALTVKQNSQGSPTADILDVQTQNGTAVIQATGPAINESALLLQSVGATRDLTLNSGSGTILLGSNVTTIKRVASALTIDLNQASTSTLTITNSDASNVASLSVEGSVTAGTSVIAPLFQSADSAAASQNVLVKSGNTTAGSSLATGSVTIKSGDGSGTNTSSGAVGIDSGAKSGSGTTGGITIGGTNASSVQIGNSSSSLAMTSNGLNVLTTGDIQTPANLTFTGAGNVSRTIRKSMIVTTAVNANDVVIIDTVTAGQVTTTATASSSRVFGVATTTQASTGQTQDIVIGGVFQVNADAVAVNIGDFLVTSTTSGRVTSSATPAAGAVLGRALSAKGAGNGLVWATLSPGTGGTADSLQAAYDNGANANIGMSTGRDITVTSPDLATDPSFVFNTQCTTCSAQGGRFAIQNAGVDVFTVSPNSGNITLAPAGAGKVVVGGSTPTLSIAGSSANATINFLATGTTNGNLLTIAGQNAGNGIGGGVTVQSGAGTTTNTGGLTTVQGGNGGPGAATAGGSVQVQGGTATGTGASNGGSITLQGGTAAGTGVKGLVKLDGGTVFTTGSYSSGITATITQSVVDSNSAILATATVGGLTFTVPSPTISLSGRILYITNAGVNAFTLTYSGNSLTLNTGSTATLVWNAASSIWTGAGADSSALQDTYSNSLGGTTPEIVLDTTRNGVDIQDVNGSIGATQALLAVRAGAASNLGAGLFVVNASGKVGINTGSTSTTPTISYDLSFGQGANRTIGVEAQGTVATPGNNLTLSAGTGNTTGAGGLTTLQGGNGGSGAATAGGAVQVQGGTATGTGASNGGNVTLQGGTAAGTGVKGLIQLNGGTVLTAGAFTSGVSATITQSVIDSNSVVTATASAAGLTFTVPAPTITTAGRLLYITNIGATNSFILSFATSTMNLTLASTATLVWNGSAWTGAGADSATLQDGYSNSVGSLTPEIVLDTTRNGIDIQDVNGSIGATQSLLAVRAGAASNLGAGLFVVNASGKIGINTGSTSATPTISYDLSFGQGANRLIGVETQGTVATPGNNLTLSAGTGNTTGAGGSAVLQGGTGGATGNGGTATIQGGTGGATSGAGGTVNVTGGTAVGAFQSGAVAIQGGTAAAIAGSNGGGVTIAGAGGSATGTGGTGGAVSISGGASNGSAANAGGAVTITGGAAGGAGAGGLATLQGGPAAAVAGSNGGGVAVTGANGSATAAGGNGGSITLTAGNGLGTGPTNGGTITLQGGSAVGAGTAGGVLVKNAANTTTAFQIQNATGANVEQVDTTDTNLVPNPGAEVAISANDWAAAGTGTNSPVTRIQSTAWNGTSSLQVVVSPTTANAGFKNIIGTANIPAINTTYTLSFYAKLKAGDPAFTDISAQYYRNSTPTLDASCGSYNTQTVVSTGWTRITCTLTTSATIGNNTGYIQIYQAATAARTFYIDAVQLEATNNIATAYGAGSLRYNATVTSPLSFRNTENSTTALTVQNASGNELVNVDTVNTTVTLLGATSGEVAPWTTSSNSLPAGRYGGSSVSLNGYIYIIGGVDPAGPIMNTVYYAKLNTDGSTGAWSTTTALPQNRQRQTSVTINGYIYVVGGHDGTNFQSTVWYARANSDGTIGSWQTANPIGTGANGGVVNRGNHSSVSLNGFVYVFGGQDAGANAYNVAYYAKANSDGSLGTWTKSANAMSSTAYFGTAATANGYAYYMGGKDLANTALQMVQYVKLNSDGSTGAWSTTTQLPAVRSELTSIVSNGYVYAISGNDSLGAATNTIYYNKPTSTGTLGSTWTATSNTVPAGKSSPQATISNGWFYYVGGWDGLVNSPTVYYTTTSRLRIGASIDLVGLQGQTMADPGDGNNGTTGGSIAAGNGTFVGSLQVEGQATFANSLAVNGILSVGGGATIQGAPANPKIFQVQTAGAANAINVTTVNLITNSNFEAGINAGAVDGWAIKGATTSVAVDNTTAQLGTNSLKFIATTAQSGVKYPFALVNGTQYTISFYAKVSASTFATLSAGRADDGATDTACLTTGAITTTWTRFSCTFTAGAQSGAPYVYISKGTDASARTINIDAVQLETAAAATAYRVSDIVLDGVITIGGGYSSTDTNVAPFNLDSSSTYAETAGTCSATANGGALYYNSSAGSNAIRACVNGAWEDLMSTAGMGILAFGVVPDSSNAGSVGDLAGIAGNNNSPCKVHWASATTVTIAPCVAYSGGRKVIVASTTLAINNASAPNVNLAASAFANVCLDGTNNQPQFKTSNATENLAAVPTWSANNPVMCLATVQASNTAGSFAGATPGKIYDIRSFTTTSKSFATINAATTIGVAVVQSASVNQIALPAGVASANVRGVLVAWSGAASATTANAIIATGGPQWVKATGTSAVNSVVQTTNTAGYTQTAAVSATAYANLGVSTRTIDTTCSAITDCQFAQFINPMALR